MNTGMLFNPRPNSLDRALAAAERAIDLDPASQMANSGFAVTQYFRRDLGAFRAKAESALALNPRCSYTFACLGRLVCYSGEWERGIQLSRRAIELSPHPPGWYYMGLIMNEYHQRRYAEALAVLQKCNKPDYWVMHYITAVTQGQLGNRAGRPSRSGTNAAGLAEVFGKIQQSAPVQMVLQPAGPGRSPRGRHEAGRLSFLGRARRSGKLESASVESRHPVPLSREGRPRPGLFRSWDSGNALTMPFGRRSVRRALKKSPQRSHPRRSNG